MSILLSNKVPPLTKARPTTFEQVDMADRDDGDGCPVTVTWSSTGTTTEETKTEVIILSSKAYLCRLRNLPANTGKRLFPAVHVALFIPTNAILHTPNHESIKIKGVYGLHWH